MKDEQKKTRPVAQPHIGRVRASIWQNEGKNGPWFTVTFDRSYRSNDRIQSTSSFGQEDLLALAKLADLAHSQLIGIKLG